MQLIAVINGDVSCGDETSAQAVTLESLQPNHADCNAKLIVKREETAWNSGQRFAHIIWRSRVRVPLRGPYLQSPDNFSGPKSNIEIQIKGMRARVLASKLLHFVLLTDSFIM